MMRKLLPVLLVLVALSASAQIASQELTVLDQWSLPSSTPAGSDMLSFTDCYDREFVVVGHESGLDFLEVTPDSTLSWFGSLPLETTIGHWSLARYQNQIFAITDNPSLGLLNIDLRLFPDSISCQKIQDINVAAPAKIAIAPATERMYVCGIAAADLWSFDLSENPSQPHFLNHFNLGAPLSNIFPSGDSLFVSLGLEGFIVIKDDAEAITSLNQWKIENFNVKNIRPNSNGQNIIVERAGTDAGFYLLPVDYEPQTQPLDSYQLVNNNTPDDPVAIDEREGYFMATFAENGVRIFNISNQNTIVIQNNFTTDNNTYNNTTTTNTSGLLLSLNNDNGLELLQPESISFSPIFEDLSFKLQPIESGPLLPCEGDEIILSASLMADHYRWFVDDSLSLESNPSFAVQTSGQVRLLAEKGNCVYVSPELEYHFGAAPNLSDIQGDTLIICPDGDPLFFHKPAEVTWTNSYWLKNGDIMPNSSNFIQIVTDGVYQLLATNGACETLSAPLDVQFNELPTPELTYENEYILAPEGFNYQWYFNDIIIPDATTNFYLPEMTGYYSVEISDSTDCTQLSTPFFHQTTSTNNTHFSTINIFPNPVNDFINIQTGQLNGITTIVISNSAGQSFYQSKLFIQPNEKISIDASQWPPGNYFLWMNNGDENYRGRFIK